MRPVGPPSEVFVCVAACVCVWLLRWRGAGFGDAAAVQPLCCSTPLGPQMVDASFRGFALLPRGYRVVRPRWGRCLRDSRPRCVCAVLMAWLRGAFPRKSLMAAAYLWCVRRVCRPRWGRCLRGSRQRCVCAVLMAWLRGAFPRKSLMAAAYLWCVRRVCRPYWGRTIL